MKLEHLARKYSERAGISYKKTGSRAEENALYNKLRSVKYSRDELAARKSGPRKRHEFSTEAWVRLWAVKPAHERIIRA